MRRACRARDASFDGLFFVGVRTTGVFCRPTCPARTPLPHNVEYFATPRDAMLAGYRACKRCRPLDEDNQPAWVADVLRLLDEAPGGRVTESDLRAQGFDPATVRRHCLRRYGMTFHAMARARRLAGALSEIRNGRSLDDAVVSSGYESHSGFRDAFARWFGTTPGNSRDRACVLLTWLTSPLGPLVAGASPAGICFLEFSERRALESQMKGLRRAFGAIAPGTNEHLDRLRDQLEQYFAGSLAEFSVPLEYPGTDFQQRVWNALRTIPYGQTRSYEWLASAVGSPKAVRAVGRANGMNRLAIVIPCHRVVNKNGQLGGYGGGLWRKQFLLDLERRSTAP